MSNATVTTVILAAGRSTRMKSSLPKALHPIAGRPMLGHVLTTVGTLDSARTVLVLAPGMDEVARYARSVAPGLDVATQERPLGTGNAVRAAETFVSPRDGVVLVIFGDTPLVRAQTLSDMIGACRAETPIVVLGFEASDPTPYGRLVLNADGSLARIVERKDASVEELAITLCNGGAMAVRAEHLFRLLSRVTNENASGEYYLPDVVRLARAEGLGCTVIRAPEEDIQGVNSRAELAAVEAVLQRRLRRRAMDAGVTLADPETIYLSADTVFGQDVTIGQNVVIGPGVEIANDVTIKPFCHIEGGRIEEGAQIGPFARIRPGSEIGRDVHIGNFVETKKAKIEAGAKINHLSYIGDARIGAKANIGAGTITCNYDGFNKHFTDIGAGAFIGSNSSLVAPVKIGDGAYTGSGSVITKDVAADALAVERSKQFEKPGWAATFRAKFLGTKKAGE
ncbi:bifunctional UDP-N-acetylglucosamine diphosphorylase/glucosamine-1-phosphate N-acetyltransferase GlmU [Parvibaculum sp.]|uniref:bifunctional UDP-N-acetylglucosamine diphosphorylase/glucosamine-1-phosphate N-acetyltransferase GlmU n=1 Tax=Parvibaculum sp. TaxID=2024848 RepID=UPI002C7A6292|nr:bifunctional UDP-N-acetylglucosamine diphosphorylase/glucosamine-1-phosphate N-acetyltransferase GlmU [Parvibaculum sp.]HUD51323.1 bifunctional UDP-N-acetylglucosamine diphosphorylase/glucosamine-1-phosphate N-acetyltransferase GlmU [Parvibaculum sp.]